MSLVENTTTPVSSEANVEGGLTILGSPDQSNRLNGSADDDILLTAPPISGDIGTNDVVDLGAGNDVAAGFGGDDSMLGGQGNDLLAANQGADTVDGGEGNDSVFAGQGDDQIEGDDGEDLLFGDIGNDVASGGDGDDAISGNQGEDLLQGDAGDDSMFGGQGGDTLEGGAGNDLIAGDRGADLMTGGEGNDTFYFGGYNNPGNTPGAIGGDTITDFTSGEDKIALDRQVFTEIGDTLEAVEFTTTTSVDGASEAKLIYNTATGELVYNPTTAEGDEVTITTLQGSPSINTDDFELF